MLTLTGVPAAIVSPVEERARQISPWTKTQALGGESVAHGPRLAEELLLGLSWAWRGRTFKAFASAKPIRTRTVAAIAIATGRETW